MVSTVLGERIGEDRRRGIAIAGHSDSTSSLLAVVSIMGALSGAGIPCHVPDMPMIPRSQPKRHKRHQSTKERERRLKQMGPKWKLTCKSCGCSAEWRANSFFSAADTLPVGWGYDAVLKGSTCPKCTV